MKIFKYQDNTVVIPPHPATLLYRTMLIEWGEMATLFMVPSGLFSPYSSLCCFLVCLTFLEEGSYAVDKTMVLVTCSTFSFVYHKCYLFIFMFYLSVI